MAIDSHDAKVPPHEILGLSSVLQTRADRGVAARHGVTVTEVT